MMLLSDGSILVQNGSNPPPSASIVKLSPQANTGSHVNGAWSNIADLNEARLFFTTAMLPDGRIFAVGGEYPKFSNTAEIYDPVADAWSYVDPVPTPSTNVFLSGKVSNASNTSPITITTSSTGQLQNGMQVTISGVGGNTAANGNFTVANVTSTSFQLVGSSGNGAYTSGGSWNSYTPQFGDDPIVVLPDGQVLAGYFNGPTTYRFNPSAPAGSQWTQTAGAKLHGDRSDEETWVKLPDGSILSYDIFASGGGTFQAQRYVPSLDSWVDASNLDPTNPPSPLTSSSQ
ncbi:MAG TPA: kelch repeat-containing protein, partial [Isosphaeraceae bacterium]|nr:kelch repeat-containing protein [Isosphaeraceae bacterium]